MQYNPNDNEFYITVNETNVKVNFGDYIIKGHNNLFYKIPAKEFEATYEEVKSRGQNERAKLRSLEEILSKIEEYENNIQFLDEEEIKEELKQELVILKWCVGLVERI